jgi:hypothetical protein
MEVAADHDKGKKGHDTRWEYLPGLLEARSHDCQQCSRYTCGAKPKEQWGISNQEKNLAEMIPKQG